MHAIVIMIAWTVMLAVVPTRDVAAEPWSSTRIARLPDSAFAVVERSAEGRPLRHLPHHDESGALDVPHLRAAISRLGQVRWRDPASEDLARCHLERHARDAGIAWRSGVGCEEP